MGGRAQASQYKVDSGAFTIGSTIGILDGPRDLSGLYIKCLTVKNIGSFALTAFSVEASPNNSDWEVIDSTTFASLGAGTIKSVQFQNDVRQFWRIRGNGASGSQSPINIWWTF